jgi:hypothetical protein
MIEKLGRSIRENPAAWLFALGLALAVLPVGHAIAVFAADNEAVRDPTRFSQLFASVIDAQFDVVRTNVYQSVLSVLTMIGLTICAALGWLSQKKQAWLRRILRRYSRQPRPAADGVTMEHHEPVAQGKPRSLYR